jgi:hypothetical protein
MLGGPLLFGERLIGDKVGHVVICGLNRLRRLAISHDQAMRLQPKFAQQLALLDCALFAQAFRSLHSNAHGRHSEHRPGLSAVRSDFQIVLA